jgi:hypothetical protein
LVEVQSVRVGHVEARTATGAFKRTSSPVTVVAVRRRHVGDPREFADNIRNRYAPGGSELTLRLTDDHGTELPRLDLDLGGTATGVTQGAAAFPIGLNDDLAAFAAPPGPFQRLYLELSGPALGPRPIRFSIPASMIVRR